jgi:hypothetical protein
MKSKLAVILTVGLLLPALFVAGLQIVDVVKANWIYMPQTPITDSLTPTIQSPINNTFYSNDVNLNFTVTKPNSWIPTGGKPYGGIHSITYMLDGQESKIYTAKNNPPYDELEASTNFCIPLNEALSNGTHNLKLTVVGITIYWEFPTPPPNTHNWASAPLIHEYSMSVSQTVTFTTNRYIESTPSPTQTPTLSPTPSPIPTPILSPTSSPTQQSTLEPTYSASPIAHESNLEDNSLTISVVSIVAIAVIVGIIVYFKKVKK